WLLCLGIAVKRCDMMQEHLCELKGILYNAASCRRCSGQWVQGLKPWWSDRPRQPGKCKLYKMTIEFVTNKSNCSREILPQDGFRINEI
ncbi:hypothetical protein CEXT_503161, partial [Caerostris extrusa]